MFPSNPYPLTDELQVSYRRITGKLRTTSQIPPCYLLLANPDNFLYQAPVAETLNYVMMAAKFWALSEPVIFCQLQ